MVWGCEWCWYGQSKKGERKSRRRSLLLHITSSNEPTVKLQGGRQSFIFMQDNASVQTAKKNLQFLDLLDHPTQSPNLNPLENIWWAIEQALLDIPLPSNANDLFKKIEQIWNNYPTDKKLKYIRSMASHIEAVI